MRTRILNWTPSTLDASFYLDQTYSPSALRIRAGNPPTNGDFIVDILCDGVSIMDNRMVMGKTVKPQDSQLEYNTLAVSTFQVGEIISGGTSSASGEVISDNKIGSMTVLHTSPSTPFVADETITGATSGATAVVNAWVVGREQVSLSTSTRTSDAKLEQGEISNDEAEDFGQNRPMLQQGSWVTLAINRHGGAGDINVQLELESPD